ncbi:zinc ribbon domain-containing protein [uncultured Sphingomonas sp.]|uniref:zinc ribbon domain-containing protein n=1 Tax=uncultured Sphingomonas sp. TaxID=158754 RepID=UPI0025F50B77|nr:zinc ribbon domain-containing protein [uncultured Sphingomonas sp.]
MAFCTQCGARLPDDARFCARCGAPVILPDASADAVRAFDDRTGASEPPAPRVPVVTPDHDFPSDGLHFGPDPQPASRPTTRPAVDERYRDDRRRPIADADDDEEERGGTGTRLLVILALVAVAVLAVVFWQQRDGTRPVAETATNTEAPAEAPSAEPTEVAAAPTPEPTPTPSDTPTPELAQTGGEIGSPASLDPNGEAAIPAAAIDAAFNDDPERAFAEFPGPVTVRGTVIGLLSDSPPAISLEGYRRGGIVVADLARGQDDAVDLLASGSVVRLRCASVRRQAATTVLLGCRI